MPRIDALETGSSAQRNGLNHQAIEDYLKTIYALAEIETPPAQVRDATIAALGNSDLDVRRAAASRRRERCRGGCRDCGGAP